MGKQVRKRPLPLRPARSEAHSKDGGTSGSEARGVKYDTGKLRYELLDDAAMDELVAVLSYGAVLYEPGGWRHVEDGVERYVAAARRHLSAWRKGDLYDPESGLLHIGHFLCCALFLLGLEVEQNTDLQASLPERLALALEKAAKLRAARLAQKKV